MVVRPAVLSSALTVSYLLRSLESWPVELRQSINCDQYLHRAYTVQQMRVVSKSSAEASVGILAREDELDGLITRQAFRMAK